MTFENRQETVTWERYCLKDQRTYDRAKPNKSEMVMVSLLYPIHERK